MSTRRSQTKLTTTEVKQRPPRLDHLIVIRESDPIDYTLFLEMIQLTFSNVDSGMLGRSTE